MNRWFKRKGLCVDIMENMKQPAERKGVLLIVDDEKEVIKSLRRIFRKKYEVKSASNAREALRIMKEVTVHVVISDQRMPEITGSEFLKEIGEIYPETVRIILTAYSDMEAVLEAINDGQVYRYMMKPWDVEQLDDIVRDSFDHYWLQAENERLTLELKRANEALERRVIERTAALSNARERISTSEARYRLIFDHSPLGIMHFDENGSITACNDKMLEILDIQGEQVPGFALRDWLKGSDSIVNTFDRCLKGASGETEDFLESRFLKVNFSPVAGGGTDFNGGIGILEDITEKKCLREKAEASRKWESLKVLSGGISHDLNNLLTVISGNIDLALDRTTEHQGLLELLKDAKIASSKAAKLIKRFYSFSRVEHLICMTVDLKILIRDAVEKAGRSYEHQFILDLPNMPLPVKVDRQKLLDVFQDLLENAVEATPENGKIEISAGRGNPPRNKTGADRFANDTIWVYFKDSGKGISKSDLPRVFDPYFSTKSRASEKGMGLTLALAHSVLRKHEGDLFIDSKPGIGTCATVILPPAD